jgi:hypothetical protein
VPVPHLPALQFIPRAQLDLRLWDACIAASVEPVLYAYCWYLDAVLPAPMWKWVGIVLLDETGRYRAVMPVPLRRKTVVGIPYAWVVHQPFFCQFLGVFSRNSLVDSGPFFQQVLEQFRYGSQLCVWQKPDECLPFDVVYSSSTHTLNLSVGYPTIYQGYTGDRKANLRRATRANWTIVESADIEPLVALFRNNHAQTIDGGVADWAYAIFRNLTGELAERGLITLRYALHNGQIEAGALFVQQENRIIYLFNAASESGRRGNARTLLIDRLLQEKAGQQLVLDFESPAKQSIRGFYQSFGAVETPFWTIRWNRLSLVEKTLVKVRNWLTGYNQ